MTSGPLPGSERPPFADGADKGPANPAQQLEVSLLLRRRQPAAFEAHMDRLRAGDLSAGTYSREDYAQQFGADPADLAAVLAFAQTHGLLVVASDQARRLVRLSGTVAQFNAAFGVDLRRVERDGVLHRGRTGSIALPDAMLPMVEAVLGLDDRPQAKPHFRVAPAAAAQAAAFSPDEVARLYGFPQSSGMLAGAGQTIAIIELGGGFTQADLDAYFAAHGLSPRPPVAAVTVDGGANQPTGDPSGPDGEVMLDIEVASLVAPGASLAVYFAPNTDAGFIDAVSTAIHDPARRPSVVSISWGGPETTWTGQARQAFDQVLQSAAALGVTVAVASGDNGSGDGVGDGASHVDFPASSPHALACGGTRLTASGGAITTESVWNDGPGGGAGGGGISAAFPAPAYQRGLTAAQTSGSPISLSGRGVPDVAGDADPATGYKVRIDGQETVIGGTSAVAPLWAGLIAVINGELTKTSTGATVGFANPALYAAAASVASPFNDIVAGGNGAFAAAPGWDACAGLGSPKGAGIAAVFLPPPKP